MVKLTSSARSFGPGGFVREGGPLVVERAELVVGRLERVARPRRIEGSRDDLRACSVRLPRGELAERPRERVRALLLRASLARGARGAIVEVLARRREQRAPLARMPERLEERASLVPRGGADEPERLALG